MNFGPQTASNSTCILPGFTDGDQQTELNQTLPKGGCYVALTTCRRTVGVVPLEKIEGQRTFALSWFFDDLET